MIKNIFKILILSAMPMLLWACIWIDGTTLDGAHKYQESGASGSIEGAMGYTPKERLKHFIAYPPRKFSTSEFEGVKKILEGKLSQAIEIFETIERKEPLKYTVAANLGTTYELYGDNHKALKWIKEGIERNSTSHYGTEWLHQRILETKIMLEKNPSFLKHNHIIPLPAKFTEKTKVKISSKDYTINEIYRALLYQLRERLIFVKPKDPVVADLLFSFALIVGQTSTLEEALKLLAFSERYGFPDQKRLDITKATYQDTIDHPRFSYYVTKYTSGDNSILLLVAGFLLLLYLFIRYFFMKLKQTNDT